MSGTLLSVKEEAREADAAWQAAAALSDLAEALAEGEAEAATAADATDDTKLHRLHELEATDATPNGDGPDGPDGSSGSGRGHQSGGEKHDADGKHLDPEQASDTPVQGETGKTESAVKEGQPGPDEDVAVRAAQALGQLGSTLMKRRPRAALKPVAGSEDTEAVEAIEAAIAAAESQAETDKTDKTKAVKVNTAEKEADDSTNVTSLTTATAAKATKTTTAAKSRAVSKASAKDLRAKLEKRREDVPKSEAKEDELKELKEQKDEKEQKEQEEKDNSTRGSESDLAAAPSAPSVPSDPSVPAFAKGTTASEQLRAKLLEAKQRLLAGANGKSSAPPSAPSVPVSSSLSLTPPPDKKEKKKDKDKEKKKDKKEKKEKKREREEAVPIRQTMRPMPKQQALPLLCREEAGSKESKEEVEKKLAIEQAKARRLEELREREAQKVQQVHSKAAARKKKEVEDSVRELARKLSQDILEISEIINVENIKEEAVKREGRVGHFGVPGAMANVKSEVKQEAGAAGAAGAALAGLAGLGLSSASNIADFVKQESVKSEMGLPSVPGLPPGLGPEQRQMIISPEMYAQQMSQLKSMETPEAMALSASSSAATPNFGNARLEADDPTKPTVCTIGWEPNVEPHVMIKLLEGYRIGSIIDARPPEFNTDGFCHACAAHGWTYDRQPVLSIHAYDLGPMGPVAFNTIGRIVSQARAAAAAGNDGSCRRQCILFAGDQSWQDECNWHIVNRLRGCAIEVHQISLDRYWDEAAVFEEETEKGGVIVAGPPLTQVVDELRNQVGLPKIGDERDRQLMVTARAGLETWVAKKFKQDIRLQSKILGPEATLKERIDCLREACPELSRVVSMAHFLRMIGNNSAHTGGAAIPPRYQLVQLVQKLTHEIKEADAVTKAHSEADKKWETAEPFAAVLAKISGEPQVNPRAPVSARLQLQSIIVPQDGEHKATLVYLHPFGSGNLRYLQGKSAFSTKGIRIVLPLAPTMPITAYSKRQCISWFDYYGSDKDLEADPLSLEDVRVRLSLTLEREATLLGENGRKRLLIGGLAQGGEAALHAALMHHQVLGGFVGVCTNLLPCTLPEGGGRMKLHFFGYDRDPKKWATQTRDPLLPHHDLVEHGDVFGEAGAFNLAKIDFKLEAQCLHCACEAVLEPEAEEETENAAPVDAADADAADADAAEAQEDTEMQDAEEAVEEENKDETADPEVDPLLNEMAAAIGIDPEAVPLLEELSDENAETEEIPGEALEAEGVEGVEGEMAEVGEVGEEIAEMADGGDGGEGGGVKRSASAESVTLMKATAKVMPKKARTSYEQKDEDQNDQNDQKDETEMDGHDENQDQNGQVDGHDGQEEIDKQITQLEQPKKSENEDQGGHTIQAENATKDEEKDERPQEKDERHEGGGQPNEATKDEEKDERHQEKDERHEVGQPNEDTQREKEPQTETIEK